MVSRARRTYAPSHLGIALSPTELCVAFVGSDAQTDVRRIPLQPMPADGGSWPALEQALEELRTNPGGARLSISLMPSLAEVRAVELPPLREEEAERVLARGAGRYFVGARQPQAIAVALPPRRLRTPRTAPQVVISAAAPARLLAVVRAATVSKGFALDGIGPAESAWAAAATSLAAGASRGVAVVLVAHTDRTDLLRLEHGRLAAVRRFRPGLADADAIASAVADATRATSGARAVVVMLGRALEREQILHALRERRIAVQMPADGRADALDADTLAAEYAAPINGPRFRTEETRAAWQAGAWRATGVVAVAACALFIVGAALHLWGVRRQLDQLRSERSALAPRLSATLVGRSSVENVYRSVTALNDIDRTSPQWARAISTLSTTVPDAAYLTALRTRGDSMIVEGLAEQASDVFNAMERVPFLANVRAGAPVRREVQSDTTPRERFTIVARLTGGASR